MAAGRNGRSHGAGKPREHDDEEHHPGDGEEAPTEWAGMPDQRTRRTKPAFTSPGPAASIVADSTRMAF